MVYPLQQSAKRLADVVVRSPVVSWSWSALGEQEFSDTLVEFRPSDAETVREMMAGRYLFASKLLDTQGVSPFAVNPVNHAWWRELHGFSWLRHFRDLQSTADKRFARTLVLDWIGRNTDIKRPCWAPALTAVRVLNWLRHMPVLTDDASAEQSKAILRSLGTQLQCLKVRGALATDPLDALFSAIALLGAALCERAPDRLVAARMARLKKLLDAQIDEDGLHRSRNVAVQYEVLTELISVRQALGQRHRGLMAAIGTTMEQMHTALDAMMLGTGEPGYFNGCGQLPVELLVAVQSQHTGAPTQTRTLSGYGILRNGPARLIVDSGLVPPHAYAREAHAGSLSFEFSHGSDLVVCNCGPAPADLADSRRLFRLGAAHSGPAIGGRSPARFLTRGPHKDALFSTVERPHLFLEDDDCAVEATNFAYSDSYGVNLRRHLTLISDGNTLVGQDSVLPVKNVRSGPVSIRFHLAPGAEALRQGGDDIINIQLKSGAEWTFLWEGGFAEIEESVRQSAYFGFFRTQQIVIEAEVRPNLEISWILTRQNG